MLGSLIKVISQSASLSKADIALCNIYFTPISISKNTILESQERTPQYLYFITAGYMRLFHFSNNGDEITSHISSPNGFITSFLSFIHGTRSTENIAYITDCELLRISKNDLALLIDKSENFKKFSLIIFEQAIFSTQMRANSLATLTAEQRYKELIEKNPQILQYVPVQYIASYLGMKPESLSRIRRQINS